MNKSTAVTALSRLRNTTGTKLSHAQSTTCSYFYRCQGVTTQSYSQNITIKARQLIYLYEDQALTLQLQCTPPQHSQGQVLPQKYQEDVSL